jgi:uncharacterized protein (DUF2062 family)
MFGFFMGIVPLWGFQLALAIAGAVYFKLNKAIVIVTANISVPPMIPLVIYFSYLVGGLIYDNPHEIELSSDITLANIHDHAVQYFVGATILSVVFSLAMGLITFIGLSLFRREKKA